MDQRPLSGIRVLALEQMQAMPYATQLLARLGADVLKVEHPISGDLGRSATPAISDPQGRQVGATFLRNNLGKKSIGIDLKSERGRELVLSLAGNVDIFAENFRAGALARMGLGFEDVSARIPEIVYVSVSGFGQDPRSPYYDWPALASVAEAMSGIYDYRQTPGQPPTAGPAGALGDIGTALFAVIGILAALRHRDQTGRGQHVDVAMLDSMIAMTDIVTNFWSMGLHLSAAHGDPNDAPVVIMDGFKANDGWFVMQVGREHQFAALMELVGAPELIIDERLKERSGWARHVDDLIRPAVERWSATRSRVEACETLGRAGIAAGPCFSGPEVIDDEHVALRGMTVALDLPPGVENPGGGPVLTPASPIKFSDIPDDDLRRVPWLGENTDEVLAEQLGLSADEIAALRDEGVIS